MWRKLHWLKDFVFYDKNDKKKEMDTIACSVVQLWSYRRNNRQEGSFGVLLFKHHDKNKDF